MDTIEALYEAYVDKIYNFCLYRTGNRFVAEDITSTTFMKFFKSKWQKVENPVAYLYTICRNTIIDHYRREKQPTVSLETLMEQGVDFSETFDFEKRLLNMQVFDVVHKLPEDQREVIVLHYVEDLDIKTIALALGKTEASIKSLGHRALETLRETFKDQ